MKNDSPKRRYISTKIHEPRYNDVGVYATSPITRDILQYQ
jgi:hypothetical protein